jgi:hypothetical protein
MASTGATKVCNVDAFREEANDAGLAGGEQILLLEERGGEEAPGVVGGEGKPGRAGLLDAKDRLRAREPSDSYGYGLRDLRIGPFGIHAGFPGVPLTLVLEGDATDRAADRGDKSMCNLMLCTCEYNHK